MASRLTGWALVDTGPFRFGRRASRFRFGDGDRAPAQWTVWLTALFANHVSSFAPRHRRFWDWLWAIGHAGKPRPFVGIWPRGGGKSTSAELGAVALGLRGKRKYALYVRETQEQADKSVSNIAALLESNSVERYYPEHADRLVGKYGSSRGWRRNRLRTSGGFTVDAIGLDTAARGVKVEEHRPDLIILDDVDDKHDTPQSTAKKIATITTSILPAGTDDVAVLAIQNLIIPHGVFAQLTDGRADFLADRMVDGPDPAVVGLETEPVPGEEGVIQNVIVAGTATWDGQNIEACQRQINTMGLSAFMQECQHQVHEREGALWKPDTIRRAPALPRLRRVVVGVDPSGGSAEIGIVVAALGENGIGYVLADNTQPGEKGPLNWGRAAVDAFNTRSADRIVAEKNFGGDMVKATIEAAAKGLGMNVPVKMVSASRGKDVRAEPVAALYEDARVLHHGTFPKLESEMTSWVPGDAWSPNRIDALVWALTELMVGQPPVVEINMEALAGLTQANPWAVE